MNSQIRATLSSSPIPPPPATTSDPLTSPALLSPSFDAQAYLSSVLTFAGSTTSARRRRPILSWLPVTAVSKRFRSVILSNPEFARSQFEAARHRKTQIIFSTGFTQLESVDLDTLSSGARKLSFPLEQPGRDVTLVGSCNGLVFVRFGDDLLPIIHELPSNLLDLLIRRLPPFALHKLHKAMPFDDREDEFSEECIGNGRKRGRSARSSNFDKAWTKLFKSRWPELGDRIEPSDWQQVYWETHLQNCLDEVAEVASLPSFVGCFGDIKISDSLLELIGCEGDMATSTCDFSKLCHHFLHFGYLVQCLRLQNVFCDEEICHLLRNSKLHSLELRWIRSKEHITALCKLLNQNSESLTSLELIHCTLSSASITAICSSISPKSSQAHGIKHFSINTTKFLETDPSFVPVKLVSFLSSGRALYSLKLSDNHLGHKFAEVVFSTLLNASSSVSILDLSENNISGWLSELRGRSQQGNLPTPLGVGKSLQALRVLNLRGNNLNKDDANDLRYALVHMPNLEVLDMSDNPIEDVGIRSLIPFLVEASEKCTHFVDLMLENCELSYHGVTQLIKTLSTLSRPLKSLSIADNDLGSQVAAALGELLCTSIKVLNVGGIGLCASGFQVLQEELTKELKLVEINISKNRGGIETANFLSKLMLKAPELVRVNAAYNLMPVQSLTAICSAIKNAKGTLRHLDLSGNTWDYDQVYAAMLADIQCNEKLDLILPSPNPDAPYDADP